MTPDDFERWGKHLPGLLRKDFGLDVDVRNAAADEIERLRARITELEAERGARLKMGQRLVEAADQWLAAEENKRPESTLRENAYQFTSVAMELADVYRQALARSTDTECCNQPDQCWEPCGDLGKSEAHAKPADTEDE